MCSFPISFQTLTSVILKGNLEYQRGNYRKAMKVINSIPQSSLSFKLVVKLMVIVEWEELMPLSPEF
jgi:hypothetical protein